MAASIRSSVYSVQLALFDGISRQEKLACAGKILTHSEYSDVVTERSIANLCGFPLCNNPLLPDQITPLAPLHRKGRYRISLREHKVYDLRETRLFCCSDCVVSSQIFASSLAGEREHDEKIIELVSAFHLFSTKDSVWQDSGQFAEEEGSTASELSSVHESIATPSNRIGNDQKDVLEKQHVETFVVETAVNLVKQIGEDGKDEIENRQTEPLVHETDTASSEKQIQPTQHDASTSLLIHEQNQVIFQNFSMFGPSDAIEGYVPQKEYGKNSREKNEADKKYGKTSHGKNEEGKKVRNSDHKIVSRFSAQKQTGSRVISKGTEIASHSGNQLSRNGISKHANDQSDLANNFTSEIIFNEGSKPVSTGTQSLGTSTKCEETLELENNFTSCILFNDDDASLMSDSKKHQKRRTRVSWADQYNKALVEELFSSSSSNNKMVTEQSVSSQTVPEDSPSLVSCMENATFVGEVIECRDNNKFPRNQEDAFQQENAKLESAKELINALTQAAEAVAIGELDSDEAVARAGIVVKSSEEEIVECVLRDLKKSDRADTVQLEDGDPKSCWYSAPPKDFKPEVSTFGMMWMALDEWISAASIAHVYGSGDEDNFSLINGKEYLRQVVIGNGVSAEIERTLGGCISRALPALAETFRLPLAVSTLEQALGRLLRTMTLVSAIPPFSSKQWRVVLILLLDALSVHRLPALRSRILNSSLQFQKALDASDLSEEQYEVFWDLLLPLGRHPEFAAHCGG